MSSINKVQLMGRLGADPEMRRLNSGDPVVTMRIATSETWRDKDTGERKERTEWHTVVIFNKPLCEIAEKYLAKGNLVYVEGQLATRAWEDQRGEKRYATEVVLRPYNGDLKLLPQGNGGRPGASGPDDYGATSTRSQSSSSSGATGQGFGQPSPGMRDVMDDEIPF